MRRRTFLGGRIDYHHRQFTLNCTVRNIDERGARLEFAHPASLPDEFDVQVARHERSYRARVAWRTDCVAGVVFDRPAPSANVIAFGDALRARQVAAEHAEMKRRTMQLPETE